MVFFDFDADGGDLALVPYQQQNQLTVPDPEHVLAPLPISIIVPSDNQLQNPSMASTMRVRTRTLPRSSLVSISHPFNFTLPETCFQSLLTMEPKIKPQFEDIRHLKQSSWLSLPERLTGWQVEKRQRHNGTIDKFYYHPTIKLRSEAQVKFYIKYGFVPERKPAKRGKRSREEASSEELTTNIVGTLLSHTEKILLQSCNSTANLPAVADKIIAKQLRWTKTVASPPPAGISTEPEANVEVLENLGASNSSSNQNEEEQIDPAAAQDQLFLLELTDQIESDYAIMEPVVDGFQTFFTNSAGDITEEAPPAGYVEPRANAKVLENVGAPSINQNEEGQIPAQQDQLLDLQLADEEAFDDLFRDDPIMYGFGPLSFPF